MACSVLGVICFLQACVLVVWAEKLYGAVTFVRAFLSRTKGPKESAPTELQMPTAAPLPIPGPALTTLVVDVEPEPEPVLPPRPSVPAPSLPPRYRSQEASVVPSGSGSASGSFTTANDHLYDDIGPLNLLRRTGQD